MIFGKDRSAIKRSAMSCNVTLCRPHQSASARHLGRHSFGPTWRCWLRSLKSSGQDSLSDAQERKLLEHHETELRGPSNRFGPAVRFELCENGSNVEFGGVEGNSQPTRDRFVGGPICHRGKHFELAGR